MGSFDLTSTADCEIVVKTFEKAAIFSADPRSVYAMTTPILSRMRSDAHNTDRQFAQQLLFQDKIEGDKEKQNAGMSDLSGDKSQQDSDVGIASVGLSTTSALSGDQAVEGPITPRRLKIDEMGDIDPLDLVWPKGRKQHFMVDCVPCKDKFKDAREAWKKFWGGGDDGDDPLSQWLEIQKKHLEAALEKIKKILDMFKKQGVGLREDVCRFYNQFNFPKCPADLLVMLKGLSTLLTKLSMDMLAEFGILTGLIGALITPLFSSFVQLLKNFIQIILEPIKCIIKALADGLKTVANIGSQLSDMTQTVAEGGLGIGVTTRSLDEKNLGVPSLKSGQAKTRTITNPLTGNKTTIGGGSRPIVIKTEREPDPSELKIPAYTGDLTSRHYVNLEAKKSNLRYLLERQGNTPEEIEINEEYSKLKKQVDSASIRKGLKKVEDDSKSLNKFNDNMTSMVKEVMDYLLEFTKWIENFAREWIKELGKLIGESLSLDIGLLNKLGKKLSLLQMILLMKEMNDNNWKCEDEDDLENLINRSYSGSGSDGTDGSQTVTKDEDGNVSLGDENAARFKKEKEDAWENLDVKSTGDPDFDSRIGGLRELFTSPTEMVFSCNKNTSAAASAAQVEEWIGELE